ncbi:MAG TPA: hypothetical protein VMW52_03050, partial [Phycisphaerae bacterium]|nr:hypothetical protein [Phycisphaerae bacterium]
WLTAKGFDPATLTEVQKAPLKASYDAEQKQQTPPAPATPPLQASAGSGGLEQQMKDIRARQEHQSRITSLIVEAAAKPGANVDRLEALGKEALAANWAINDVKVAIMETPPMPLPNIHAGGGSQPIAATADVLEAAVVMSSHIIDDSAAVKSYGERTCEAAHKAFKGTLGLQELMIQCAEANGYSGRRRVTESNWREMLSWAAPKQHGSHIQAAGFSTVDLTGIVGNVANKALGTIAADPVWLAPQIAGVASHSNFHSHTVYSLAMNGELLPVAPQGEIRHLALAEESYTRQVSTRGAMLRISRTDIINDELGAFTRNATGMARKAYTTREKALFTAICATAAGASHFTAARGNYLTGGTTVCGEAGLDQAVAAFRGLDGPDGDPIMVEPAILLVPSTLEGIARRMLSAGSNRFTRTGETLGTAIFQSDANIYAGRFGGAPLVSPWLENAALTGASSAYYYLLADPRQYPCFEIAYLNGAQAPTVEYFGLDSQADTLGMTWRIYWDFGVGAAEWRAGVKVAGA